MKMAGTAFPVRRTPDRIVDYDENIHRFLQMLEAAPQKSITCYETNNKDAAHLGELSTTSLKEANCRGAVIDGGVRDLQFILDQDFPVFSRYTTPADAPPRWRIEDWNVPIQIGGVEIRPGDILVGDADGVVCVPKDIKIDVLERAESKAESESKVRNAIKNGESPTDTYEKFAEF
jgi:regulator of RNase E activity RraA